MLAVLVTSETKAMIPALTADIAAADALVLIASKAASKSEMAMRRRAGDRGDTVKVMVCIADPAPKLSKTCMPFCCVFL